MLELSDTAVMLSLINVPEFSGAELLVSDVTL